jgi:hypothetical protein
MERLWPALEDIDTSTGALGGANLDLLQPLDKGGHCRAGQLENRGQRRYLRPRRKNQSGTGCL